MTIGVCKDCKDRHPACWGTCERYLSARKELETKKAAKLKDDIDAGNMNAVQYNGLRMYKRWK